MDFVAIDTETADYALSNCSRKRDLPENKKSPACNRPD